MAPDVALSAGRARPGVWLAFTGIYLIWGTTYFAIAILLRTIPPFVGACLRFLAAAGLMWLWVRVRGGQSLRGLPVARLAFNGVLLLGCGNGLTSWAQQGVPSGIAALLIASTPVPIMVLDWAFFSRRAPQPQSLLGVLVGLGGVGLIVTHLHRLSGATRPLHVVALLSAMTAWSLGTLLARGLVAPERVPAANCVQLLAGGSALALMATWSGEWQQFHPAQVTSGSWLALLYLSVFGSVVALGCYMWLLTQVPPQKATTYALVNPLVALLLGALLLGERISDLVLLAVALILAGVALVLFTPARRS